MIDYIELDNPAAAQKVFRTIDAVAGRLADFPEMGRAGRLPGTRELAVPGLPYLVVYQVAVDAVIIVAVFHGARDLVRILAERRKATCG
ncbi:MAG TPA: type II toxin-antitoxin system RelE/ParE family toxin [Actinobacteria bacterium]|nr:type II toxin-antitoxin system RelE/ParE family toxin [Actinomycetota bacterium]